MGKKLYVGGITYATTDETLKTAFEKSGFVESAKVIVDRDSGRSKGFGFVEMSTDEEAQEAIKMYDGQELDGRTIKCNEARPQVLR